MSLKALLTGTAKKKDFARFFFPVLGIMLVCWLIAQQLYDGPESYSILRNFISEQGDPKNNPVGCWFFIVSTGFTGIFLNFYFLYLYRRMMPTLGLVTKLMTLVGFVGCIGFSLVGFFPTNASPVVDRVHNVAADLAFYGLGIAAGLSLFVFLRKLHKRESWPTPGQFLAVFVVVISSGIAVPLITISSLQQWMGFFTILVWVVGTFLISPSESISAIKN